MRVGRWRNGERFDGSGPGIVVAGVADGDVAGGTGGDGRVGLWPWLRRRKTAVGILQGVPWSQSVDWGRARTFAHSLTTLGVSPIGRHGN